MATRGILLASLVLSCLIQACYGAVLFSSLKKTLQVTTSTKQGVLQSGEDKITVTWGLNQSLPAGTDSDYKTVELVERPYNKSLQTLDWIIERDVPTATYFVRAYAFNDDGHEVAYGQSTNDQKTTNLFEVQAISGRHVSLDIASVCFSAFSVVSLAFFFFIEKRKGKTTQQK
ncbi:hypothetical protein Patl1_18148 [Pistacia atlantica]|uniref:Uncharacterized protein n=1 Tax=Pistacia atlantica TaxID=434234 RepID=A0ACC1BYK9_9ROSI|nr:hypothetical protein Patl1_18148 [Pistacia atlantica]